MKRSRTYPLDKTPSDKLEFIQLCHKRLGIPYSAKRTEKVLKWRGLIRYTWEW